MCSPPHSQVMEIRAKRYKTNGISANHKHSISAAAPSEKTLFKALLTQDKVLLPVANLLQCWAALLLLQLDGGSQSFYNRTLGSEDQQKDTVRGLGGMRAEEAQPSSANQVLGRAQVKSKNMLNFGEEWKNSWKALEILRENGFLRI